MPKGGFEPSEATLRMQEKLRAMDRELSTVRTPGDAALGLIAALEQVGQDYREDDRKGFEAALAQVVIFCDALGRNDLGVWFRHLAQGLSDVREGRPGPPFFQPAAPPSGRPKAEQTLVAETCAHFVVLKEDLGLSARDAARALTKLLAKRGATVRRNYKRTDKGPLEDWQALDNQVRNIRKGNAAPGMVEMFELTLIDLRRHLAVVHPAKAKEEVLRSFDGVVRDSRRGRPVK